MTQAREIPDLVQWHEGMLLAPQHFQQLTAREESLLRYHLHLLTPFYWGLRHMQIDQVALVNGTFRVLELEAVLPDGLVLAQTPTDPELSVSLRDAMAATPQIPVSVHLVVPVERAANARSNGALSRYSSYESAPVADANTGEGEIPVPRLKPRASLIVADVLPDKYVSLQVAQVAYRDEAFVLTDFIPPLLTVTPQSDLGRLCADIVRRVREKAAFLADRARATAATGPHPLVVATQRMAQNLSTGLPPVEVLLRTGVSHPFAVFSAMATLVGQCAGAGPGIIPPVLDPYNHAALRSSFGQIEAFLTDLLDGIREEYRSIPFRDADGTFELPIELSWLEGGNLVVGVLAPPGVVEADVADWFDRSLIASRSRVSALRERRIRGPARTIVPAPETLGIAPRRGEVIFTVEVNPQYVEAGEVLQILHPLRGEAGRPREIVLYAPEKERRTP